MIYFNLFPIRVTTVLAIGIIFFYSTCVAQVSLVPANHPIYEWLHHQRVMGNAPDYQHESIPLSRGNITDILNKIDTEALKSFDLSLHQAYLQEFHHENLLQQSGRTLTQGTTSTIKEYINDKVNYALASKGEKHIYAHYDSAGNGAVDLWYGNGFISTNRDRGGYNFLGIRAYASTKNLIGFHIDYQNVSALNGNLTLQRHPVWQNTWSMKRGQSATIYAQAFGSFQMGRKIRLDIGRGMLNYGPGTSTLILSREAPDFDWARFTWKSKYIDFDYIHGMLQSFGTVTLDSTIAQTSVNFQTRIRVPRWFVLRRLNIKPTKWLSLAYTQTNIYSNRGLDFSQLNPFLPTDVSEINNQDLDNPAIYLDLIVRPHRYLEFYGSFSATDLNKKSDVFKRTGNRSSDMVGVFAHSAGLNFSYSSGTDVKVEYTQLDPYFYTHKFRFNTYENFDQSLGAQFGPNADQWLLSIRQWLPRRSWMEARFTTVRHGLNTIEDGTLNDVGGDLFEPQQPGSDKILFLNGDLHRYHTLTIIGQSEPIRGLRLNLRYEKRMIRTGSQIPEQDYLELGISIGY